MLSLIESVLDQIEVYDFIADEYEYKDYLYEKDVDEECAEQLVPIKIPADAKLTHVSKDSSHNSDIDYKWYVNSNGSDQHWLLELDALDPTVYNNFKDFFSQLDLEIVKLAIIYKYEVYSIYNEEFYCGDGNSIHLL